MARLLDRVRQPLAAADVMMNRLYGWRGNPLYHSGVLAASLLAAVLVSGVYLLLFYRIGSPWESVARITRDIWLGQWMRSFHRYASDASVVAVLVHALRITCQRRTWGPRALAWITGLILLAAIMVCGWTGYVMVWDVQGEVLAREGARFLDVLPLFSEPITRAFSGERAIPAAFFFLNLFAHVALPVGLGLILWLHVARVARPQLVPPRRLLIWTGAALGLASLLLPIGIAPKADLFRLPGRAEYDVFFAFFLPLTRPVGAAWLIWVVGAASGVLLLLVPVFMRPRAGKAPPPSVVDQSVCTGCEQCYLDCPFEAIAMVPSPHGRDHAVAQVDPDLCTSCGLCAGSCAPMAVGPPGRTGREQLVRARAFAAAEPLGPRDVVIVTCAQGGGGIGALPRFEDARVYSVSCAGNLHSSIVESLVRSGAAGVLVVACPPRDCWNREGPAWTELRLFHDREAELQPRVDRRRVRMAFAGERERHAVSAALADFRLVLAELEAAAPQPGEIEAVCESTAEPVVRR